MPTYYLLLPYSILALLVAECSADPSVTSDTLYGLYSATTSPSMFLDGGVNGTLCLCLTSETLVLDSQTT